MAYQKEQTVMRLTSVWWRAPKGRELLGCWVAVYTSAAGTRVHYWEIDKAVTKDQKDKADQLAAEYGKGLTWESIKAQSK